MYNSKKKSSLTTPLPNFSDQPFRSCTPISVLSIFPTGARFSRTHYPIPSPRRDPLSPQVIQSHTPRKTSLPLLRGLALVFPMSTATLYIYRPDHLYMLRKYLNEGFVVTPPEHSTLVPPTLGTVCHVEEIVSVGKDGA